MLANSTDGAKAKPNIMLIFSDQQHWQAMGFVDSFFDTPHIDALAKQSIVFENSFCTTPQCSPSRSSLLTGFYSSKTGVIGNVGAAGGEPLAQETLAPELKSLGYNTGYFGKWHLGDRAVATRGWDQSNFKTHDSSAESDAVAFLRRSAKSAKPFALFVSFNNPHDIYHFKDHSINPAGQSIPLPPSWDHEMFEDKPSVQKQFMLEDQGKAIWGKARSIWEKYRDCYRTKTRLYDNNVGSILNELKKQGLWDRTIVIATSDHGDMDTNHRLIFKGPFMYEHMVRIPLIICVPDQFRGMGAQRITDLDVVNVDIAPTIRDFCGLKAIKCDGVSLMPTLTGQRGQKTREFVIGQYYSKQRWVNPIRMIRAHDFKLNKYIHHGEELYDLKNDPHELKNLSSDRKYADVKMELSRKLDSWIRDNKDPFYSLKATTRSGKTTHRC
ncbi:MAG: sulfatase family protein [Planctomycetota bacterium]